MVKPKNIAESIISTAQNRGPEKSTCPSEIARGLFPDDWRTHMKEVLAVAIELEKDGRVIITQKGSRIDTNHIKGPVRIKIV
ncbi:DUF3253 domain-containing protein [Pedobacter sp. Leaf132]|uniref:DUF3253 domain-containing protein n=1 Tax=Pedobacter sp. Leaf132 TaxID=2876557 RepID=UPI001E2C68E3|nr:DUF3253 domain-containing protein [Pedobacter sp. Leaf132]